nr:hypothetical protein [Tanacetum cinerariifolium]
MLLYNLGFRNDVYGLLFQQSGSVETQGESSSRTILENVQADTNAQNRALNTASQRASSACETVPSPIASAKENTAMFFQHQHDVNVLPIEMLEAGKKISKVHCRRIWI